MEKTSACIWNMTDHLSNDGPMASYLSIEIYVAVYKSDHYIYMSMVLLCLLSFINIASALAVPILFIIHIHEIVSGK